MMIETTDVELRFRSILYSDAHLRSLFTQEPYVFISSVPSDQTRQFLMFWLYIEESSATRKKIWHIIERVVRTARDKHFFSGMTGAEIVPCFIRPPNHQPERILRLSFSSTYIDALLEMKEDALNPGDVIADGARCSWYLKAIA